MSFKIGVIGCGNIATQYHGPALARYAASHPDMELVACCDVEAEKARRFAERFQVAHWESDFVEMLRKHRPDAVCLFSPPRLTCDISCRVMEMGFPLLLEKPPGRTTEEIDRMIAVAEASGVLVRVAYNRRYMPLIARLKECLGQLFSPADIHHIHYEFARWNRADADFSQTAIHGIDTVRFLAGSDYRRVRFHYQPLPHLGATVANFQLDCAFASEATAHLSFCPVAGVVIERAVVHARDHTFFLNLPIWDAFDSPGRLQHLHCGKSVLDISGDDLVPGNTAIETGGFYAEDAAFLDEVRAGHRGCEALRDSRQSVAIAQAMRLRQDEYVAG